MVDHENVPRQHKDIGLRSLAVMFKDEFIPFTGLNLPKVMDVVQTNVPLIEVKDRGMDLNFLLEDETIAHIEFESTPLSTKDLIRFAHYDLELFNQRKQSIRRIIIFSAGISTSARRELDIGSVKQHHECIFLEHDFNGDEIWGKIKERIIGSQPLTNMDKLHILLYPMMKSVQYTISEKAYHLTKTLQMYKNHDEAHYLIGAMMAINYNEIKEPEKSKILEVLEMAKPFEDLYKKFEQKGIEKGIEQGIEQGIEHGRKEERKAMAVKLLSKGIDINMIKELTGMDESEIELLKHH